MRRSQETFDAAKAATAGPAMVLSIVLIPIIVVPAFVDVDGSLDRTLNVATWFIWAAFVLEYLLLLAVAPDRLRMVRTHILELVLIAVPIARPFRALRFVRLLRIGAGLGVAAKAVGLVASRRSLQGYVGVLAILVSGGALMTYMAERDQIGSNIQGFPDALWWAIVTCTTVGYGDHFPVTPEGRAVGIVLMFLGIGLLSILTASVAAHFVESDDADEITELRAQFKVVNDKLDLLLAQSGAAD